MHPNIIKKAISLLVASTCIAGTAANHESGETPIEIEYPKPFLIGTPVQVALSHLEVPGTPAPTIMAPTEVSNIARGKKVTSSDDFPIIGELEYATDGEKESEEGYFVELDSELEWVQIDLEATSPIYAVAVWHFHTQKRAYHDVVIQISDDVEFKEDVTTIYNNDHDNSSGLGRGEDKAYLETNKGKLVDAKKAKGRYVRLYSAGNTSNEMNHIVEVEVFGIAD